MVAEKFSSTLKGPSPPRYTYRLVAEFVGYGVHIAGEADLGSSVMIGYSTQSFDYQAPLNLRDDGHPITCKRMEAAPLPSL